MMGARQAQDANGIKMQNGSYMKGLQAMISDTHSLLELLPVVQKELEILPFDSQKIQAASQTVSKGFPQDVVTLLDKAEMPKEHRLLLEEAMMNADIMKQSQEIRSATEKLATAISELTIETRDISTKVFAPKRTKQKGLSQA